MDDDEIVYNINQFGTLAPIEITFGGLTFHAFNEDVVVGAKSARLQYAISNKDQKAAMDWEQAVLDWTGPYKSDEINIFRITKRSIDDEVVRLVTGDSPLFVGAIFAIVLWLACTFACLQACNPRGRRLQSGGKRNWAQAIERQATLVEVI